MEWFKRFVTDLLPEDKNAPDFWQQYVSLNKSRLQPDTPIRDVEFVVFDTETTGLDVKQDNVLSIGAVKVHHLQVLVAETFECLIKSENALSGKSAEVHGLLTKQLEEGISEKKAIEAFIAFIGNAVLVGQHVAFDVAMVNQLLKRQGIKDKLRNQTIDTAQLAIRLERKHADAHTLKPSEYSLDALCARYNLPTSDRHTASGDAFITAILLLKLLAIGKKRGILTIRELLKK